MRGRWPYRVAGSPPSLKRGSGLMDLCFGLHYGETLGALMVSRTNARRPARQRPAAGEQAPVGPMTLSPDTPEAWAALSDHKSSPTEWQQCCPSQATLRVLGKRKGWEGLMFGFSRPPILLLCCPGISCVVQEEPGVSAAKTPARKPQVSRPPTGQVYERMSCCCSLGWFPPGASAAHPQEPRHHRNCPPPEPGRLLLLKQHLHHSTMSFYGQRRADNRRSNSAQQTPNPVIEKSVDGGDDDDGRSTTKAFKKRYEIAIPTRNLRWTNLAKYLELEFKELGVQVPKDQKVRHSSGCVCLRHQ